jgi:uncharacterized protein YecT (DUF1311 family)
MLCVGMAHAQPALNCNDAQTQGDLNECAGRDLSAADAKLNTAYRALQKALGTGGRSTKLRVAQTAWISLRDKECDFEGSAAEGGSMQPMLVAQCVTAYTTQRTADLTRLLQCAGNGC